MTSYIKRASEWILCRSIAGIALSRFLGDWITSPAVPRGFPPVRVLAPRAHVSDATRASLFWGFHEAQEIRYVRAYLTAGLPVVELGTSLGVVAAHIAQLLNGLNKLVCVEANPPLLALARETVLANSSNAEMVSLSAAVDYSGARSSSFSVSDDLISSRLATGNNTVQVPTITLSAVLAESGVEDYALVCDVEGAELQILENDIESLARCRMMIIELHATARASVADMAARIEGAGFNLTAQHGAVFVFSRT